MCAEKQMDEPLQLAITGKIKSFVKVRDFLERGSVFGKLRRDGRYRESGC